LAGPVAENYTQVLLAFPEVDVLGQVNPLGAVNILFRERA